MTLAVRGFVELYKAMKREKQLHRFILTFLVSHDHSAVKIYDHYPLIEGDEVSFYRHLVRKFDSTEQDGKEK